jgi:RNA polymerase sigma factor (sigma-70 family)
MATVAIPAAKWSWESPYPQVRTSNSLDADVQLVERCLGGQEAAWEDLVKVHTRRVYSICYRFTNSDSEAQDLTQDVFLRVFKNLRSFRAGEGLFVVWLTRLTRNLLIDHYRRSRMDRATESIEDQTSALEENPQDGRDVSRARSERAVTGCAAEAFAGAAGDGNSAGPGGIRISRDRAYTKRSGRNGEVAIESRALRAG